MGLQIELIEGDGVLSEIKYVHSAKCVRGCVCITQVVVT